MGLAYDTADRRADLVGRICEPASVQYLENLRRSAARVGEDTFPAGWTGQTIADDTRATAEVAELFTVTPEMLDLLQHASRSLPPQQLDRFDLPSPVGWLHLPKNFSYADVRGNALPVRDVMWAERRVGTGTRQSPTGPGLTIWVFLDGWSDVPVDPAGDRHRLLAQQLPHASLAQVFIPRFGHEMWSVVDHGRGERVAVDEVLSDHDGEVIETRDNGTYIVRTPSGGLVTVRPDPLIQFLKTYFHFVQSELTTRTRTPLPRSQRKTLRRFQLPTGPVTVIELRKHKSDNRSGDGWALTYRYVRRGHWRKQWYGSGETRYQKHIWIAPTIVGPEDGPLRVRDVVNVAKR